MGDSSLRRLHSCLLVIAIMLGVAAAPAQGRPKGQARPTIVFMTDFGVVDDSVAICKGVMYSIEPAARIMDLTHQVTAFSILRLLQPPGRLRRWSGDTVEALSSSPLRLRSVQNA